MASSPFCATLAETSFIIDAVRCRSLACDRGEPVLPALHAMLEPHGCGILAPAVDSMVVLSEAWSGREFRAGRTGIAGLSGDEYRLLNMLQEPEAVSPAFTTGAPPPEPIARAMTIAIRSLRIMLRQVFVKPEALQMAELRAERAAVRSTGSSRQPTAVI